MKRNGKAGLLSACLISVMALTSAGASDKKGVIMTVDGEDIPTEEFLYLFHKNNQQQVQPQSLDEYLSLFEIYRLKVAEAKAEGVDTSANFKNEIRQYKKELVEPYITDTVFVNELVDIAVEREKQAVESSHIMIIRTHDQATDDKNLSLLDSIRNEILKGGDFIEFAKTYSQDKFSKDKGGYLGFNPAGTFPYAFETAVYETPEGEISEIVESHVGWHIVKSGVRKPAEELNFPVKSYEEIKTDVLRKTSSPFDSRFHEIRLHNMNSLKAKHPHLAKSVENLPSDEAYEVLVSEEEAWQYSNNADYRNLIDEYTNGSLLYEVSVKNIWDKAGNDEEALQDFYQKNKANYKWDSPHAKGVLVRTLNDSVSEVIKKEIAGLPSDSVVKIIRKDYRKEAAAEKINLPQGVNPQVDFLMFNSGEMPPAKGNLSSCFIVEGRLVEQPEDLNDVKSAVVSDFQEELEAKWVENLKNKHSLQVNKKELDRVRKSLKK